MRAGRGTEKAALADVLESVSCGAGWVAQNDIEVSGAATRSRTSDPLFTREPLFRLSYDGLRRRQVYLKGVIFCDEGGRRSSKLEPYR